MFKVVKYLFLANLYKRAKRKIILFAGLSLFFILFSFMINDLISISTGISIEILFLVKWVSILSLIIFMMHTLLQIINIATTPFKEDDVKVQPLATKRDTKKEHILNKDRLYTKSDLILQKYMKEQ